MSTGVLVKDFFIDENSFSRLASPYPHHAGRLLECLHSVRGTDGREATAMTAKPRKQATRQYPTPALEKGLDILELLASEPAGLSKSDVARRLGRTVSEIFRMLLCLEERGYISQSRDSEHYRLTLRLFKLAQEHPPTKRMIAEALPIMQQVAHETNQSCHLGVLEGGHVVIVAQVDSHVSSGFYVRTGAVVDLMHAATGYVILAHQTPEVCSRAIEIWSDQSRERPPRDLIAHLAKIQSRGYEERASYEVDGVINISFPVLDDRGCAIAALTVPFLQRIGDQATPATVRKALEKASMLLSEAMGGVTTAAAS
jgi:DNA-binding IclR family transcriptional regulator